MQKKKCKRKKVKSFKTHFLFVCIQLWASLRLDCCIGMWILCWASVSRVHIGIAALHIRYAVVMLWLFVMISDLIIHIYMAVIIIDIWLCPRYCANAAAIVIVSVVVVVAFLAVFFYPFRYIMITFFSFVLHFHLVDCLLHFLLPLSLDCKRPHGVTKCFCKLYFSIYILFCRLLFNKENNSLFQSFVAFFFSFPFNLVSFVPIDGATRNHLKSKRSPNVSKVVKVVCDTHSLCHFCIRCAFIACAFLHTIDSQFATDKTFAVHEFLFFSRFISLLFSKQDVFPST